MNDAIESKVRDIILRISPPPPEIEIDSDADLIYQLGFNSIKLLELIIELESAFGIEFDDEELVDDTLTNYGRLTESVRQKSKAAAAI